MILWMNMKRYVVIEERKNETQPRRGKLPIVHSFSLWEMMFMYSYY
jgi:hypothetical protein